MALKVTESVYVRERIYNDLVIKVNSDSVYGGTEKFIIPSFNVGDKMVVPFNYGITQLGGTKPERECFRQTNIKFDGSLREQQTIVKNEATSIMSKTGSIVISTHTGFGKTVIGCFLICSCKLPTIVIVNRLVLIKQWIKSISSLCSGAKIEELKPNTEPDVNSDVWIVNAENIEKFDSTILSSRGLVIVDECHLIMAESLSRSLLRLYPRYLVGLSATPYRNDGLDVLMNLYFGEQRVTRNLQREHLVYRVNTGFVPVMEKGKNGKISWTSLLKSQAENEERNELIVKLLCHFKDRKFIVLVKMVSHGERLAEMLSEKGENVTTLFKNQQKYDEHSRILIGTTNKLAVGFDHPSVDSMLLATDIESYFEQCHGRVFRRENVVPLIIDLVDSNHILRNHFSTRESVYIKSGGKIKPFDRNIL